jgi:hypothetical protein
MLIVFTLATAGVVLLVVALATEQWWLLPLVVVAHLIAFLLATGAIFKATEQQTKPDPVTEARVEEEQARPAGGPDGGDDDDEPKMAI